MLGRVAINWGIVAVNTVVGPGSTVSKPLRGLLPGQWGYMQRKTFTTTACCREAVFVCHKNILENRLMYV